MRIDAYTHFMPSRMFKKLVDSGYPDIGKRMREVPCIHDLDERRRVVDTFKDYAQIISYAMPPLEAFSKGDGAAVEENARLINDEFVEICAKHNDPVPGWVAQGALGAPDAGVAEARRAIANGALGVQIYTNVVGKPLDDPAFEPFFAAMEKLGKPIWLHPARGASTPDYAAEQTSKYEIWWGLGWPYETSAAMARLVFSGLFDRHPGITVITHHLGGIVPYLEGRVGYGWDQLGVRTSQVDYEAVRRAMKKRPIDYFKQFYADTATFGSRAAMRCGLDFFAPDQVLFASDMPFDPTPGLYMRETIAAIESLDLPSAHKEAIYAGNARRLLRLP